MNKEQQCHVDKNFFTQTIINIKRGMIQKSILEAVNLHLQKHL